MTEMNIRYRKKLVYWQSVCFATPQDIYVLLYVRMCLLWHFDFAAAKSLEYQDADMDERVQASNESSKTFSPHFSNSPTILSSMNMDSGGCVDIWHS